ncbi:MAG TPA: O-antigen ligase domain-containing protein [Halococcus sp.]|nr:O-antigen ligase domain-containing protein [Halococcus sp.]
MSELSAGRLETSDNALLTGDSEVGAYLWTSVLLTGLLVLGVPVVATVTAIPTPILVVVAGLCYLAAVVATGNAFEGLTSAVFVLALFDIAVTLAEGPGIATADIVAVDVVAVPLLFVLLYDALDDGVSVRFNARSIAVFGFVAFVCWSFAAGIVGNGVSQAAGLMSGIEQLRYLVVFAVALLVVRRKNVWCVVYPFVIAVAGNLLVSLAQIKNGGMLGFPFLGEPPDRYLESFTFLGHEIATGFYAGGFVGHGRELAMVLFMFIPLVVAVSLRHSWPQVTLAGVAVAASVFSIRVADTDAGWGTLILLGVLFGAYLFATLVVRVKRRYSTIAAVPVLGIGVACGVVLVRLVWAVFEVTDGIPLLRTNTLEVRLEEYVTAIQLAFKYPLFGIGGYNFYVMSEQFGLPPDTGVHNTILSHLAGTGFVGAFFYLLVIFTALYLTVRLAISTNGNERLLWVAVFCAMVAYHAYSSWMSSYHWTVGNSAFWLLCGATIGAAGKRYRSRLGWPT